MNPSPRRPTRISTPLSAALAVVLLTGVLSAVSAEPGTAAVPATAGRNRLVVDTPVVVSEHAPLIDTDVVAAPGYTGDLVVSADPAGHNPRIRIERVFLDCAGTAARAIYLSAPDDLLMRDVEATGCTETGVLRGAVQARGNGATDLTQNLHLERVVVRDVAGNGVHVGHGVRGVVYRDLTVERAGGDGLTVDGSESRVEGLRARGNGRAGLFLRNLLDTFVTSADLVGNGTGLRAVSLVGADVQVSARNNRVADVHLDPMLIGGCLGPTVACPNNYGRTQDVLLRGVAGPLAQRLGPYGPSRIEVPLQVGVVGPRVDVSGLLITQVD